MVPRAPPGTHQRRLGAEHVGGIRSQCVGAAIRRFSPSRAGTGAPGSNDRLNGAPAYGAESIARVKVMPNNLDIFTKKLISVPTEEHVLPNSLGGRLKVLGLIDQSTNSLYGATIDAALSWAVAPVRVLLNLLSSDGHQPAPIKGIPLADGRRVDLYPGGRPSMAPRTIKELDEGGNVARIHSTAPNAQLLLKMSRRLRRDYGINDEQARGSMVRKSELLPTAEMTYHFTGEAQRSMAKMVCTLYAARNRASFLGSDFDGVRACVRDGDNLGDHVTLNPDVIPIAGTTGSLGPLDHLLVVRSHAETGRVEGLVVLYGYYQFLVFLGTTIVPETEIVTYRVDQLAGTDRRDDPVDQRTIVPHFHNSLSRYPQGSEAFSWGSKELQRQVDHLRDERRGGPI